MKYYFFLFTLFNSYNTTAQKIKADSLSILLAKEKADTNKVTLMWQLGAACNNYNPDTAIIVAEHALFVARKIKYIEGESRTLGVLANAFIKIGNYPRALEFYLDKLKIEEKRNNPRNLASVIMNIGIVYLYQEQYDKALSYYFKADSVINASNVEDLKYNSALNIGDVYNRLNKNDSAFFYFKKSLELARGLNDGDYIGSSMVGLGHSFMKQGKNEESLLNYKTALPFLYEANDEDLICEASIGLAKLFDKLHINDSAEQYARVAYSLAQKDGFLSWQLEAAVFLSGLYKKINNMDSAVIYFEQTQLLKDSISSKERIRELQVISSNEQLRQLDLAENKRKAKEERHQQLQWLFIGIFIPGLFLITLLLSRIRIHVRVIKFMGIISLLILFEYLTLLLHPYVVEITHHTPVLELLIFVIIAAMLIPTHHHIEHWLIEKLTQGKQHSDGNVRLKVSRIKIKKPLP